MPSAILLQDTVTTLNDSAVRLVYEGTTTGTKTITVPEVTARMVTDNTTAYDNDTSTFIANTLASGAIIERGSNANGSYVKYADGTLICFTANKSTSATLPNSSVNSFGTTAGTVYYEIIAQTFPLSFIAVPSILVSSNANGTNYSSTSGTGFSITVVHNSTTQRNYNYSAIGRWK